MTTQSELDVWSSRLYELKIEEQSREIASLRALVMQAMGLVDERPPYYPDEQFESWWDKADAALRRTESYGLPGWEKK